MASTMATIRLLLTALVLALPPGLGAQESGDDNPPRQEEDTAAETAEAEDQQQADQRQREDAPDGAMPGDFTPSEKISEDLSVPFPVDI